MLNNETIIIILIIILTMNSFVLGYLLGNNNSRGQNESPRSFFKEQNKTNNIATQKINIDDTKFVGSINTDNIEKKYTSLGETKKSEENISGSINKLKNMKG